MLEPFLQQELVRSEKRRLDVFLGLFLSAFVLSLTVRVLFSIEIQDTFSNQASFYVLIAFMFLMVILVFLSRRYIIKVQAKGIPISKIYYGFSMFIEVLVPAALLVIIATIEESSEFLNSPAVFLYFILITVSSLHLSFWYSSIMGVLIGVFYAAYTYFITSAYPLPLALPVFTFYIRAFVFTISGICAGLVARELRGRLMITYSKIQEKNEIEGLFNQQVSRELVEVLKEKKDYAVRQFATVIFLDMRDFTSKVQHLSPEHLNSFQNQFFSPIIQIINDHGGIVNQILGDGLMATFGIPEKDQSHTKDAWKAVQNILEYVNNYNDKNQSEQADVGIGMHYGEVLVGNIGTEIRRQLSVSGRAVIVASRIEQLNKEFNSTLLMSGELYELLASHVGEVKSSTPYKLKGIDNEVNIVQIL